MTSRGTLRDPGTLQAAVRSADESASHALDDARVFQAVEEYLAELEAGTPPDREAYLARHAEIAGPLARCLAALEFVHGAAPSDPSERGEVEGLRAGSLLGGFRIVRPLGRGGMGVVYLAEDTQLGRSVALKVIKPSQAADAVARKRFLREAQAAASVQHDHIVTTYQVGEDQGVPFLAMELLQGESLEERLRRGPALTLSETLRIVRETSEGLAAAHERGFIHRDIKPANIYLVSGESSATPPDTYHAPLTKVKILDFGLARPAEGEGALTQTGVAVGTPYYMSPEQAAGDAVDQRSDLFSLGCVLYRLLTGAVPFSRGNLRETFKAVMLDPPESRQVLYTAAPRVLADFTLQLLAKDPKDRPQSAREVCEALQRIEQDSEVTPTPLSAVRNTDTQIMAAPRPSGRRRWVYAAAVMLLVGVLVCVGYQIWANGEEAEGAPNGVTPSGTLSPASPVDPLRPFVIVAAQGGRERNFPGLHEALATAVSGEVIEIRGNGPFVSGPIRLGRKKLVIRAGAGFWPLLRQKPETVKDGHFISSDDNLVLEGLELHRISDGSGPRGDSFYCCNSYGKLRLANCRIWAKTPFSSWTIGANGSHAEVRNCLFVSDGSLGVGGRMLSNCRELIFHNNLFAASHLIMTYRDTEVSEFRFHFARNTFVGGMVVLSAADELRSFDKPPDRPLFEFTIAESIIDPTPGHHPCLFALSQNYADTNPKARRLSAAEAEVYLKHKLKWVEERNVYAPDVDLFGHLVTRSTWDSSKLANWDKYWGLTNTGSIIGPIAFQGGDLGARARTSAESIVPQDFQLAAGSAGKGARKDGGDLGADVSLVGPGPAYEIWKRTSDYRQWLAETGQQE